MTPTQIFAIGTPIVVTGATLLVHFLSPHTVAEVAAVLGLVITMLQGVANVFVVSPSTTKQLKEGSLRPAPMNTPPPPKG
jgi:hypothetical protein